MTERGRHVEAAVAILRSNEIWGAWRVFLDNVWSFDAATKHRHKSLCFVVKYGFKALNIRNALCDTLFGTDGKEPDLR